MTNVGSEVQTDARFPPKCTHGNDHNFRKLQKLDANNGVKNGGEHDKHSNAAASKNLVDKGGNEEEEQILKGLKRAKMLMKSVQ